MDLDLETFLVALYVIADDLYQSHLAPRLPASGGPTAQMSESEVLCPNHVKIDSLLKMVVSAGQCSRL